MLWRSGPRYILVHDARAWSEVIAVMFATGTRVAWAAPDYRQPQ